SPSHSFRFVQLFTKYYTTYE
ncbi:CRISPR-associated DxTHG motif protein, partial [Listeria monocytogenes]|nr:CRISPR-associated DxTHG motif protein [Listeria monocytogenes]